MSLTISQIRSALTTSGFHVDRHGNMLTPKCSVRVHFSKISLRVERKVENSWRSIKNAYLKDVSVVDGVVVVDGLKLALKP